MRASLAALVVVLAAAVLVPEASAARRTITMSGATPTGNLTADLAYFYRHSVRRPPRFSIVGGGTGTGIADVSRRIVDIGLASRPLEATDPPGLVLSPIAISGLCLVTNRANPIPGLNRAQVNGQVAGLLTNWTQIPGSARSDAIVSVAMDERAGARSVFLSVFIDLTTPIAYQPRTLATAAQVRDYVREVPGALGYIDLAYTTELHSVPYEGIPCTRATVRSGAYPARRPLSFVTRGRPRGEVRRFLRWIRHSKTARRVVATRYVPVTTPGR
ncbi:MAG TPA: substrate-binding domain-containing protein [Solirubrobacteraceae bacterium]|nr:substrate-binding domain-containing protein [Solirubrobacteraceae bacterium]